MQGTIDLPTGLQESLSRLGLLFLAEFYEEVTQRQPGNVESLAELGQVYTLLGRHQEGLLVDRQLVRLVPQNPTAHYNLACSLALLGQKDDAMDALERSTILGFDDGDFMASDEDLAALWAECRFRELVRRLGATACSES